MDIEELSANMGHAGHFPHIAAAIKLLEAGVAIRMQKALETGRIILGPFAPAIRGKRLTGDIVVMDNLPVHRAARVRDSIR